MYIYIDVSRTLSHMSTYTLDTMHVCVYIYLCTPRQLIQDNANENTHTSITREGTHTCNTCNTCENTYTTHIAIHENNNMYVDTGNACSCLYE